MGMYYKMCTSNKILQIRHTNNTESCPIHTPPLSRRIAQQTAAVAVAPRTVHKQYNQDELRRQQQTEAAAKGEQASEGVL